MNKLKLFISSVQNEFAEEREALYRYLHADPLLAEPMYLTGYIERLGTGTRDMIRLCKKAGLPEPEFAQEGNFKLIFRRKKHAHRTSTGQVPNKFQKKKKRQEKLKN